MGRRSNGEGTLYNTIQKDKKKKHLWKEECNTCKNCSNRSDCNNRTGWDKCEKCKKCEDCLTYCDRFYCRRTSAAQAYVNGERKTIATGKKKKDVISTRNKKMNDIENENYVVPSKATLSQMMRKNEYDKFKYLGLSENSYLRNIRTIEAIEKHPIAFKEIQKIKEEDFKKLFVSFVESSQSQLEKVYDIISGAVKFAIKKKKLSYNNNPISDIKRNTFVSEVDKKEIIAFEKEEQEQLIKYINSKRGSLVTNRSAIDNTTIENLIKLALATAMRCGELGALDYTKHINFENKEIIVKRTLTRNLDNQIVLSKYTKTGKKRKKNGEQDIRNVPFDMLFDGEEVAEILREQIIFTKNIENNTQNLLFCRKDGGYISHTQVTNIFKRICRSANVKLDLPAGCHIHMTKHTGVTRMIEAGMSLYAISKLVGTSPRVLEKTYAHILDTFVKEELEKTDKQKLKTEDIQKQTAKIIQFKRSI